MMKWTVLSDNRTNDSLFQTEHGLSVWLETERWRILLDTGASDVFIRNAERLGIDLSTVDYVFISHGHSDHAGGLRHLMNICGKARTKFKVIVSPHALSGKFFSRRGGLHSITPEWPAELNRTSSESRAMLTSAMPSRARGRAKLNDCILPIEQTQEIADGLHVIAHIPHVHPKPAGNRHLYVQVPKGRGIRYVNDDFRHELALYTDGLLFTGCAHSGLENILSACPYPVTTVVGGFHLLDGREPSSSPEQAIRDGNQPAGELTRLAQRLKTHYPETQFFTSHCTGDHAFATLKETLQNQLSAFCCGTTAKG